MARVGFESMWLLGAIGALGMVQNGLNGRWREETVLGYIYVRNLGRICLNKFLKKWTPEEPGFQ